MPQFYRILPPRVEHPWYQQAAQEFFGFVAAYAMANLFSGAVGAAKIVPSKKLAAFLNGAGPRLNSIVDQNLAPLLSSKQEDDIVDLAHILGIREGLDQAVDQGETAETHRQRLQRFITDWDSFRLTELMQGKARLEQVKPINQDNFVKADDYITVIQENLGCSAEEANVLLMYKSGVWASTIRPLLASVLYIGIAGGLSLGAAYVIPSVGVAYGAPFVDNLIQSLAGYIPSKLGERVINSFWSKPPLPGQNPERQPLLRQIIIDSSGEEETREEETQQPDIS